MNAASDRPWSTVTEIAEHLRVAPITIYRWLEQNRIPAHRVGRQWRFQVAEVDAWILRGEATKLGSESISSTTEVNRDPSEIVGSQ